MLLCLLSFFFFFFLYLFFVFFFYALYVSCFFFFFFQAEDGIRDGRVTGVQTCALPIFTLFVFKEPDAKMAKYAADKKLDVLYAVDTKGASWDVFQTKTMPSNFLRSEERRVGKECRSRWSPYQ